VQIIQICVCGVCVCVLFVCVGVCGGGGVSGSAKTQTEAIIVCTAVYFIPDAIFVAVAN